jgi:hypothetical protein
MLLYFFDLRIEHHVEEYRADGESITLPDQIK